MSRLAERLQQWRYELWIGLRYTGGRRRNRLVSFISMASMLGIAIGVMTLITVLSVVNGFERELKSRVLAMSAHASIYAYEGHLQNWSEVAQTAARNQEVSGVAPFVSGDGMLRAGEKIAGVILQGVLPEQEGQVSELGHYIEGGGSFDVLKPGESGILIGRALAQTLGVEQGDRVGLLMLQTQEGGSFVPRLRQFRVAAIFNVGLYEVDKNVAFIHMADAQSLYDAGDGVTGIHLKLRDPLRAPMVAMQVARSLPGTFYVDDWTRSHENSFRAIASTKSVMFLIFSLIVAVAAFNIVSTLVMVVQDKQAAIAILRTLGATPRSIMLVFMVQGTLIGAVGTLIGAAGGVALSLSLETLVHAFQSITGHQLISAEIYNIAELPADLALFDVLRISALTLALGLCSTLYPAWRASRSLPAEALRYE